jgi:hypothetical protein
LTHFSATTITRSFTFPGPLAATCDLAFHNNVAVRSDPFASAKSHFFDTSSWGAFCDVTLTMKQTRQSDSGAWVKIDDYRCRQAFRHFMSLLNRAVYGAAFRRYGKRLRVLPVLERGELHARALRSWERGTSGRWHIHCAIELPSHCDAVALERLIRNCWAKVKWGSGRILVRDGANALHDPIETAGRGAKPLAEGPPSRARGKTKKWITRPDFRGQCGPLASFPEHAGACR